MINSLLDRLIDAQMKYMYWWFAHPQLLKGLTVLALLALISLVVLTALDWILGKIKEK